MRPGAPPFLLFVRATRPWVPHPLWRSWPLLLQLRSKGWVRSPFDSHRPIASQSFRRDAEIVATHPSLLEQKQKRSSAKDGAPTFRKQLSVIGENLGHPAFTNIPQLEIHEKDLGG